LSADFDFQPILYPERMAKTLLTICILVAFFVRDLRLLVAAGRSRIATACAAYAVLFLLYSAALGSWLRFAQIQTPDLMTIDGWIWAGIVAIHVILCGLTWWLSREGRTSPAWVVALAPSPAVLFSLCLVTGALPAEIGISLGLLSLPLFSLIWIALIAPLAYEMVRVPLSDRFLSLRSLRFVALLNLSSLLCFVDQFSL
jgi:hypothetical protein